MDVQKIQVTIKDGAGFKKIEYSNVNEFKTKHPINILAVNISNFSIHYTTGRKFSDSVRYASTNNEVIAQAQRQKVATTLYKYLK